MSIETWFTFVAASLVLTITPGPSILLGVVHAMRYGLLLVWELLLLAPS